MPTGKRAAADAGLQEALTLLLAAITGLYLAVGIWIFGRRRTTYSHRRHTISELGEVGSPDAWRVACALFLPVGVATASIWYLSRHISAETAALAGVVAIGYIGAAIFPCDPGSPAQGSLRQTLHNLAGGVEYIGGAILLITMRGRQELFLVLGCVVALATVLMSVSAAIPIRGLTQRIAEACLFGGLILALRQGNAA